MAYRLIIIGLVALLPAGAAAEDGIKQSQTYSPPAAKEGHSYPDCFCTNSDGDRVELGERACLEIGTRRVWARCDMSLNNPAWREDGEGCPAV